VATIVDIEADEAGGIYSRGETYDGEGKGKEGMNIEVGKK
jgi:hypothetical protein